VGHFFPACTSSMGPLRNAKATRLLASAAKSGLTPKDRATTPFPSDDLRGNDDDGKKSSALEFEPRKTPQQNRSLATTIVHRLAGS
jgi:hypothetical protein